MTLARLLVLRALVWMRGCGLGLHDAADLLEARLRRRWAMPEHRA